MVSPCEDELEENACEIAIVSAPANAIPVVTVPLIGHPVPLVTTPEFRLLSLMLPAMCRRQAVADATRTMSRSHPFTLSPDATDGAKIAPTWASRVLVPAMSANSSSRSPPQVPLNSVYSS